MISRNRRTSDPASHSRLPTAISEYEKAATKSDQFAPNYSTPFMCNRWHHMRKDATETISHSFRFVLDFVPKNVGFRREQQSVFIMLPADREGYGSTGEYYPLELMVIVMFLFQLLRVGKLVHRQCTTDVFLIDWEKVTMVVPVGLVDSGCLFVCLFVGWLVGLLAG